MACKELHSFPNSNWREIERLVWCSPTSISRQTVSTVPRISLSWEVRVSFSAMLWILPFAFSADDPTEDSFCIFTSSHLVIFLVLGFLQGKYCCRHCQLLAQTPALTAMSNLALILWYPCCVRSFFQRTSYSYTINQSFFQRTLLVITQYTKLFAVGIEMLHKTSHFF